MMMTVSKLDAKLAREALFWGLAMYLVIIFGFLIGIALAIAINCNFLFWACGVMLILAGIFAVVGTFQCMVILRKGEVK